MRPTLSRRESAEIATARGLHERAAMISSTRLAPLVTALVLLVAHSAHAESGVGPMRCTGSFLPSRPDAVLPANAPAIVAVDTSGGLAIGAGVLRAPEMALPTTSYPLTIDPAVANRQQVVRLPEGTVLEEGRADVRFSIDCPNGLPQGPGTWSVTVGPSVPLPKTIGVLAAGAPITIDPSPELKAFAELTRFRVDVDDVLVGTTSYRVFDGTGPLVIKLASDRIQVGDGYDSLQPKDSSLICKQHDVPETRTITLHAEVAGATSPSDPLRITTTFPCDQPSPDAPLPIADAGASNETPSSPPALDGCAMAAGSAAPVGAFAIVGLAIGGVLRRRRARH